MSQNLTSEIDEISLADAVSFIVDNRGKTVPTAEDGIGNTLIATNCISNEHLYPLKLNVRYVSQEIFDNWFRSHPEPDDIIITNKGSNNGEVCLVPDPVDFCIAQDMVALRADKEKVYPYYLFASLRSPLVQRRIKRLNVDAVIPHFKKSDFDKLLIPLPLKKYQKFIGDLYMVFSRKIENLRKQNETLETIAQTLFKHWFVDFEFPNEDGKPYKSSGGAIERSVLGKIAAGWQVAPFETTFLIPLRNGLTKPRSVRGEGFYMVNMGELFANKRIGDLKMDRVQLSDSECEKSLLEVGDLLFARQSLVREGAGQCSIITEAPEPRTYESHLIRCRIDRKKANPFYFFYHFWSFAGGFQMRSLVEQVAAAGIRGSELAKLEVLIPPVELQDKFFAVIEPLEKSIALNFQRIHTLTKTRDVLLPKLMSGKLCITE